MAVELDRRSRRRVGALLVFVLAGWVSAPARAHHDLSASSLDALLDMEVSSASKFTLRASESPSSATVIGADEIRALGYRTLAEALQSVRGLVVSSDRAYTYLGVRGFAAAGDYNTRILLLIDGNRVNDTVYEQAMLGTDFPLDLDLVERIEFIPGQGSAVHGGNALFGVVNVVTRRPGREAAQEVSVLLGSARLRQLRVETSRTLGDGHLLLSASTRRLGGHDVRYDAVAAQSGGDGISHATDHERIGRLYLKYEQGDWVATLVHHDRTKGLSATPGAVFDDSRNQYRDQSTLVDATLSRPLTPTDLWKLRLYAGRYDFAADYLYDIPPLTLNRDLSVSRWWGLETQWLSQRFDRHRLVLGAGLEASPRRDQANRDEWPTPASYLDDRRHDQRQSLYAEDQWAWSPRLSVTGGLRWDRIERETAAVQFSPRLAVVGRPADDWVLKFLHGTGFRAPNAYESYYTVTGSPNYAGNPTLHNERVRGSEWVAEYRPDPASRHLASVYVTQAQDLLVQDLDATGNTLVYGNVGSLRTQGLELETERVWPHGLRMRANYSLQRTRDASSQTLGSASPLRMGKLALVWPLAEGWTLGSQTIGIGRRGDLGGYALENLTLSKAWSASGVELSLSVHDLFDQQPADPGSDSVLQPVTPQDGRSWQLKLTLKF